MRCSSGPDGCGVTPAVSDRCPARSSWSSRPIPADRSAPTGSRRPSRAPQPCKPTQPFSGGPHERSSRHRHSRCRSTFEQRSRCLREGTKRTCRRLLRAANEARGNAGAERAFAEQNLLIHRDGYRAGGRAWEHEHAVVTRHWLRRRGCCVSHGARASAWLPWALDPDPQAAWSLSEVKTYERVLRGRHQPEARWRAASSRRPAPVGAATTTTSFCCR